MYFRKDNKGEKKEEKQIPIVVSYNFQDRIIRYE